jgi:hypothetical protein
MKVQIVLMSCITLLLASCVQTNEHGTFRSEATHTLIVKTISLTRGNI